MNTSTLFSVTAGFVYALASAAASPATPQIVEIRLQDRTDPSISGMAIKTDRATVKAGRIVLQAVNESKEVVHEVLIVPAPSSGRELPYDARKGVVLEERVHPLGEIQELKPGARGRLTLNLKAGTYLLLCNQPGHYKAGMATKLVVVT
jgi:uncharacterized cupredoxin-like copper-binding protein